MSDQEATVEELRALIAELDRQMAEPMPPALRQEAQRGRDYAEQTLRLIERPADEYTETMEEELAKAYANVPRPLRGTATLAEASKYVRIVRDVEPWQVWVRWDDIPPAMRETVTVLATLWTDTIKGRPLGRPRKSSN